jgi:DNA repair protein RecO (recombination protein O)
MAELVDHVAQEGERDNGVFLLLRAGLQALDAGPKDPAVFVDAFLLRLPASVGFPVFTRACAVCRAPGEHLFLSVKAGGALCADCAPTGTRAVDREIIEVVAELARLGQWAGLPALARDRPAAMAVAASYARAFAEHHLDRRLKAYDAVPRA